MNKVSLPRFLKLVILMAMVAALVLQACLSAQAQPDPSRPDRPKQPDRETRPDQPGGPPGFRGGPGQALPLMERVLTEEQRDSLRQAMESQREKMRGLQENIRAARQAMMKAALADEFKEDVVKAKALEVAKLEAEVGVMRLRALSEVQPALTEEQLEKILNPPQPQALGQDDGGNRPANRRANRPPRNAPEGGLRPSKD